MDVRLELEGDPRQLTWLLLKDFSGKLIGKIEEERGLFRLAQMLFLHHCETNFNHKESAMDQRGLYF